MKTIHLLFCTLAITLASCDNNDDASSCESSLPPATTTGANTFGACINGKLLIPRSGGGSFGTRLDAASFYGGYPNSTDYYELDIRDLISTKLSSIFIHLHNVDANGLGSYTINESNGQRNIDGFNHTYLNCRVFDDKTGLYQNYRSFEESGIIQITHYNLNNRLISGTFNGNVVNSANPSDTIHIKQGRFDLNWRTLPNVSFP
jgi:hypothetical protein